MGSAFFASLDKNASLSEQSEQRRHKNEEVYES